MRGPRLIAVGLGVLADELTCFFVGHVRVDKAVHESLDPDGRLDIVPYVKDPLWFRTVTCCDRCGVWLSMIHSEPPRDERLPETVTKT